MSNDTPSISGGYFYPLFQHMMDEHGLTLLETEMNDIICIVEKMILDGSPETIDLKAKLEKKPTARTQEAR